MHFAEVDRTSEFVLLSHTANKITLLCVPSSFSTSLFLRLTRLTAWALLLVGLPMQAWVRDRFDGLLSTLFYGLPLPVLLIAASWLLVTARANGSQRRKAVVLTLIILAWWSTRSWNWQDKPPTSARLPGEVRVIFWNLSRPSGPLPKLQDLVGKFDPDFIGCTEPGDAGQRPNLRGWQALLPGYSVRPSFDEMLWFTRSEPFSETTGKLDRLGNYAEVRLVLNAKPMHLLLVDLWADPRLSRALQMQQALALVHQDPSAIVLGDFNTPSESVHFDAWRSSFVDACDAGGRGWRETWPYGVPLLSLDHVMVGKDWRVLSCRKVWSASSDHAALLVRVVPR